MKRPQMNDLKQKIKEFIIWFTKYNDLCNKNIDYCSMTFTTYKKTKSRMDLDNLSPKFFLDGFVESQLIVDDDYKHLHTLILQCKVDKDWPRTEILIEY